MKLDYFAAGFLGALTCQVMERVWELWQGYLNRKRWSKVWNELSKQVEGPQLQVLKGGSTEEGK